jgi:hypothetical protein
MPSSKSSKTKARHPKPAPKKSAPKPAPKAPSKVPVKAAPKGGKAAAKPTSPKKGSAPAEPAPVTPEPRRIDGRRHLLSLSFVRDGDEFLARMETDSGHITELKNRALDQLLTLVAGELEDLLD